MLAQNSLKARPKDEFAVYVDGLAFYISFRGELVEYYQKGKEWRSPNAKYLEGFLRPVATFVEQTEKGTWVVSVIKSDNGCWFVRRDFWISGPFYSSGEKPDMRETYMIDPSSLSLRSGWLSLE